MARSSGAIVLYIMVFVASIVGITLLPEFTDQCVAADNHASVTGVVSTVVTTILPLLYAVLCIAGMVAPIYKLMR